MTTSIRLVAVVLLWVAVAVRARTLQKSHTSRALWLTLVVCAVAATIDIPAVSRAVENGLDAPNVADPLKHSLVVVAGATARDVVVALASGPAPAPPRRRHLITVAAVLGLWVAFAAAPVHDRSVESLTATYADDPRVIAYWMVFLGFAAYTHLGIARVATWHFREGPPGPLRGGMAMVAAGAVAGLLYDIHKTLYLGFRLSDVEATWFVGSLEPVEASLLSISLCLLVAGTLWPSARQSSVAQALSAYRSLRRLRPLWQAVSAAVPEIVLHKDDLDVDRLLPLATVHRRLYDRVVEIQDGWLTLQPYVTARMAQDAAEAVNGAEHSDRDRGALVQAVLLHIAVATQGAAGSLPVGASPPVAAATGWTEELRRLERVASQLPAARNVAAGLQHVTTPAQERRIAR